MGFISKNVGRQPFQAAIRLYGFQQEARSTGRSSAVPPLLLGKWHRAPDLAKPAHPHHHHSHIYSVADRFASRLKGELCSR